MIKGRPPRLPLVFAALNEPTFFITFGTLHRQAIPDLIAATDAFRLFATTAAHLHDVAVGRYVVMPDHVHLFVTFGSSAKIDVGRWVGSLKRAVSVRVGASGVALRWQPGFFDHLLRSDESYDQKWNYVRDNPVRAGLVSRPEDWPHAGEIVRLDRV